MSTEIEHLRSAISALEAQRSLLGDAIVEAGVAPLKAKLATLTENLPSRQERKQVTALFADISGYTALSERLDAEDVAGIINSLWSKLDEEIAQRGGTIIQHSGDAVYAVWGAKQVREDDAVRAVLAALAMQEALTAFRQQTGHAVAMRIGINSGPVLVGEVGINKEFTALGDTINVAARMESSAPVGGVVISHDTYRLVEGRFQCEPREPLKVKGKSEPMKTYVVKQAITAGSPQEDRARSSLAAAELIGRESVISQLGALFHEIKSTGRGRWITVIGEPGVGKTRLLAEFKRAQLDPTAAGAIFLKGRSAEETQTSPHYLLRRICYGHFGLDENAEWAEAGEKIASKIRLGAEATGEGEAAAWEVRTHFIAHLLGKADPHSPHLQGVLGDKAQLRDRALAYLADYFAALSRRSPVTVFLEDLHWADQSSLTGLIRLFDQCKGAGFTVLSAARSAARDWLRLPADGDGFVTLALDSLPDQAMRRLAPALLGGATIPEELLRILIRQADGNPLYLEELIKMLIDERVISRGEQGWEFSGGRIANLRVPPTLSAVLQARFDSLGLDDRGVLQRAAVVGRTFWDETVQTLTEDSGLEGELTETLVRLSERELVAKSRQSMFVPAKEYFFRHALMRDAAYESVLKRERKSYHRRVAEWLITRMGENRAEFAAVIAEHLHACGETARAAQHWAAAGEYAFQHSAFREAESSFRRAMESQTEATELRTRMRVRLGEALLRLGENAEAETLLQQAVKESELAGQHQVRAAALSFLGVIALNGGRLAESKQHVAAGLAVAREMGDRFGIANALIELAWANLRTGDSPAAAACFQESLDHFTAIEHPFGRARALEGLAVIADSKEEFEQSLRLRTESLELYRGLGSRQGMSVVLNNLGELSRLQGKLDEARDYYARALQLAREIEDKKSMAISLANIGHVTALSDLTKAEAAYREGLLHARSIGALPWVFDCLAGLARLLVMRGQAEAGASLAGALEKESGLYADTRPIIAEVRSRVCATHGAEQATLWFAAGSKLGWSEAAQCYLPAV